MFVVGSSLGETLLVCGLRGTPLTWMATLSTMDWCPLGASTVDVIQESKARRACHRSRPNYEQLDKGIVPHTQLEAVTESIIMKLMCECYIIHTYNYYSVF